MNATKLLLLMGPTGCGKSTVVRCLEEFDQRFTYISPYTTRHLREGEKDKVFITDAEMERLSNNGELVVVNNLYGIKYGTPRTPIELALEKHCFPVIDWPIQRLGVMEQSFSRRIFRVYIKPPSVSVLAERLRERVDYEERLRFARTELEELEQGNFHGMIDLLVSNETDKADELARAIYESYLIAIQ